MTYISIILYRHFSKNIRTKCINHYSTPCLSGHTWNTVFSFGPHYRKKMWTGWRGSREGPQQSKDWEACHVRKGRELGLFSLEKSRLKRDHHVPLFKGWLKRRWRFPFYKESHGKTRGNGYKLLLHRFRLDTRGKFFTSENNQHCDNLPREVVDSSTLDTYELQPDRVLGHLV